MYKGIPLAEIEDELYPDDGLPTSARDLRRPAGQVGDRKVRRNDPIRSRRKLAEVERDTAGSDDTA